MEFVVGGYRVVLILVEVEISFFFLGFFFKFYVEVFIWYLLGIDCCKGEFKYFVGFINIKGVNFFVKIIVICFWFL